jgi:glycosyltransferase involved in cell wall biosynthesis
MVVAVTSIVFLTPSLPLPFGRTDARWLHAVLPGLQARGFEVTCVSCTEETADRVADAEQHAKSNGYSFRHVPLRLGESAVRRKARSLVRPRSEFARCQGLLEVLEEERPGDDGILHVEHLFSSWATRRMRRVVTYLLCLEVVDWAGRTALSKRERIDLVQMRRATNMLFRSQPSLIAMTGRLATEVERYGLPRPPVAPVGIDPSLYPVLPFVDAPVLGVIGSMNWYPSRAAAERVLRLWPLIRARVPDATLLVGGWGSEHYLGRFFPLDGAELVGPVEHPEDFFGRVAVLLYPPPRGTGMKIKVLEALAYGVPVISNAEGFEGLRDEDGRDVIRAERDDEIVHRAVEVLRDPCRRMSLRSAGRDLIERDHNPTRVTDQLIAAYDALGLLG